MLQNLIRKFSILRLGDNVHPHWFVYGAPCHLFLDLVEEQGLPVEANLVGTNNASVLEPDAVTLFIVELKAYDHDTCLNEQDLIDVFVFPEVNGILHLNPWLQVCEDLNHKLMIEFVIPIIISLKD